jgi:hypothetical protein
MRGMAKEKISSDTCPICHQPIDVAVRMAEPFLFVKKVDPICFVCYSVPKMWYRENDQYKRHDSFSEKTVRTVEEMVEDGFNPKEAKTSIKAVISFWKKYRKLSQ